MEKTPYFWEEIWSENMFDKNFSLFLLSRPTKSTIFQMIKKFRDRQKSKKLKIVEMGCGSGLFTLFVSKKFGLKPFLFDISPASLKTAKLNSIRLGVHAHIKYGNILNIPLPSDFSEIVWSGGVNEHFTGRKRIRAFSEMIRITKKGGITIIVVPSAHAFFYRVGKWLRELVGKFEILEIPYSESEVKKILKVLSDKYRVRLHVIKERFLSSLFWLFPGRFWIIKKLLARISNKRIPILDVLGSSLVVIVEKI